MNNQDSGGNAGNNNQKLQKRAVKIKIGLAGNLSNNSVRITPSADSECVSREAETPVQSKTLFELCDTSTLPKSRKRSRSSASNRQPLLSDAPVETQTPSGLTSTQKSTSSQPQRSAPQVEVINGQIIIKESSLILEEEVEGYEGEFEEVQESGYPTARYSSFLNRPKLMGWSIEETRRFYQALRQCGTDFSLMQAFFPGRTRRHLKLKFFREEKQFPELMKAILRAKSPLELTPFQAHFGDLLVERPAEEKEKKEEEEKKEEGDGEIKEREEGDHQSVEEEKSVTRGALEGEVGGGGGEITDSRPEMSTCLAPENNPVSEFDAETETETRAEVMLMLTSNTRSAGYRKERDSCIYDV
eukprot:CAMPEP_0182421530 /NCGR_PEP_ID=MMETSP1167-20130531/6958_1 /TAXON_ID=2988 /ORGANISM="Mallomonas Sp, Strain CCMP3275" /LENGTH=357 /DNA_ID=CAMNT_0024598773 /DNA_START=165 /DNA_END=1238 /DNA_ORIENTATION=+